MRKTVLLRMEDKHKIRSAFINDLLDVYERSSAGKQGQVPTNRSISVPLYRQKMGQYQCRYNVEDSQSRNSVNSALKEMEDEGLIQIVWQKRTAEPVIDKIKVVPERIHDLYKELGRHPAWMRVDSTLELLEEAKRRLENDEALWAKDYIDASIEHCANKRTLPAVLDTEPALQKEWIDCVVSAANLKETTTERVFSSSVFHNSKTFEKEYRTRLAGLVRKWTQSDESDSEILPLIGLVRYPEKLMLKGDLTILLNGCLLQANGYEDGISLSCQEFCEAQIQITPSVSRIVTIENKANFYEYIKMEKAEHEIVIYHGGQISPIRIHAFRHLYSCAEKQNIPWVHWSDIDAGGFIMLKRLRENISSDIQPWLMDVPTLTQAQSKAIPFDNRYAKRIQMLLEQPVLANCSDILRYMLEHRIKLEQEQLLTAD